MVARRLKSQWPSCFSNDSRSPSFPPKCRLEDSRGGGGLFCRWFDSAVLLVLLTNEDAWIFRSFPSIMCYGQFFSTLPVDFVRILQGQALAFVSLGMNPAELKLLNHLVTGPNLTAWYFCSNLFPSN